MFDFSFFQSLSLVNYDNWLFLGFLLGFGALFGDSVKSFFKRRSNIKPGHRFIPFDQLDYSVGSLLFASIIFIPPFNIVITIFIVNFFFHIVINHLAFYLKLSRVKW